MKSLLDHQCLIALARVHCAIEDSAFRALIAMGSGATALTRAWESRHQQEIVLRDLVNELRQHQDRLAEREKQGVEPFDPHRWAQTCHEHLRSDHERYLSAVALPAIEASFRQSARAILGEARDEFEGIRPFDAERWERTCDQKAAAAYLGCGQSDVLWSRNLHAALKTRLDRIPVEHQAEALQIAEHAGYQSAASLQQSEDGSCAHGLDPDCCPMGCGDLED